MTLFRFIFATTRNAALVGSLLALSGVPASAALITYTGEDVGAGPGGPFTNSNAAAASFATAASAIGNIGTITFENATLGTFSSLGVAPGVTVSGASGLSINDTPDFPASPQLDGFNTTPGGARYVEDQAGSVTFSFSTPTQFFGAYLTGLQIYYAQDVITFSDGTSEMVSAPETGTSNAVGATDFVGFTDQGKSISSITITSNTGGTTGGTDFIGIDDVRFQAASLAAPEPGSGALALSLIGGLWLLYRSRKVRL